MFYDVPEFKPDDVKGRKREKPMKRTLNKHINKHDIV
jgi:hypothetical protein